MVQERWKAASWSRPLLPFCLLAGEVTRRPSLLKYSMANPACLERTVACRCLDRVAMSMDRSLSSRSD
jgi:hypothetical protein